MRQLIHDILMGGCLATVLLMICMDAPIATQDSDEESWPIEPRESYQVYAAPDIQSSDAPLASRRGYQGLRCPGRFLLKGNHA